MKKFLDVEANRRAYHADRTRNSVHRASLMVPEIPGAVANISFLNHFLLKRDYKSVACRITAIDPEGNRIESRLFPVDEPRVYTIPLTGMVESETDSYMVEFFAPENLFIPFPAVMVNHLGDGFQNSVHAYNRVLNDVFEDDEINQQHQREAAIDVRRDDVAETFIVFQAGPRAVDGVIEAELKLPSGEVLIRDYPIVTPKLCHRLIRISEIFPEMPVGISGGVLKISQPHQFQFYGRMLVGQIDAAGRFSANHSYYDCASFSEYWENDTPSARVYPYLSGYRNLLRFYPIMSPGEIEFQAMLRDAAGNPLAEGTIGAVSTPDGKDLEVEIGAFARHHSIDPEAVSSFTVQARPVNGKTPTRINHQIVYDAGGLESSINISLGSPNVFAPKGKTGFAWGQAPIGGAGETALGLVGMMPRDQGTDFTLKLFSELGQIAEEKIAVAANAASAVDLEAMVAETVDGAALVDGTYLWYQLSSDRPDISAFVASRDKRTGNASGEHNF